MAAVLVVEDDPDAADALAEVLRIEGHEVRIALDGAQGLSLLQARMADLVLLDVDLPVLDGPAMAAQMLAHDAGLERIPVVLVSGTPDLARLAKAVGTPYFLPKPCSYEGLLAQVSEALKHGPRSIPAE